MTDHLPPTSPHPTGQDTPPRPAPMDLYRRWYTVMDGQQLRELRRQHGLTRADLAAKAHLSTATIARLEQQAHPSCRTYTALRLAEALGEQATTLAPTINDTTSA
jgi:DNA-binding XRE family transcriptional regulator